jgi:hypothetical protein
MNAAFQPILCVRNALWIPACAGMTAGVMGMTTLLAQIYYIFYSCLVNKYTG